MVPVDQAIKDKLLTAEEAAGATEVPVYTVPGAGAFKMVADPAAVNWPKVIAILFVLVIYVTMVYGPDCGDSGRDVPDPHPLHGHVLALSYR